MTLSSHFTILIKSSQILITCHYSQVDIVGGCNKTHGDPCRRQYRCTMEMKSKYKFYLSFENSQCQEYITEKFWKALNEGMVSSVHKHSLVPRSKSIDARIHNCSKFNSVQKQVPSHNIALPYQYVHHSFKPTCVCNLIHPCFLFRALL